MHISELITTLETATPADLEKIRSFLFTPPVEHTEPRSFYGEPSSIEEPPPAQEAAEAPPVTEDAPPVE